uniref:Uncharacterized protein n=1 Tax=Coturnix japonica TaxID=93934 RepID=A0A8C2TB24_COTJA
KTIAQLGQQPPAQSAGRGSNINDVSGQPPCSALPTAQTATMNLSTAPVPRGSRTPHCASLSSGWNRRLFTPCATQKWKYTGKQCLFRFEGRHSLLKTVPSLSNSQPCSSPLRPADGGWSSGNKFARLNLAGNSIGPRRLLLS